LGLQVSFLLPFIDGPGVRFVGATQWTVLAAASRYGQEVKQLLQSHQGPVFVLLENPDVAEDGPRLDLLAMRTFGIDFNRNSCQPVLNNISEWAQLCRWR
jgi:hypothetical protein